MEKILLPHQYYYPHMDLLKDKSSIHKEKEFFESLDANQTPNDAMIYVHIPFCDSKCVFCGFDKVYDKTEIEFYADMLNREIELFSTKPYVKNLKMNGIHFGGGTPTILPETILGGIIDKIRNSFNITDDAVLNIEGSATTLYKDSMIGLLKEKRVSRVSVGVQTFYEKLRSEYNCKASLEEVYRTLNNLKEQGIVTYIDIMYGYPDFGIGDMHDIVISDLKKAAELQVEGIDFGQIYPFSNPMEKVIKERNLSFPSAAYIVDLISAATKLMESSGYTQKTAYGFTKKGEIIIETSYYGGCRKVPDCLAFGSGAFGFLNGYKYRNTSYNSYINRNALCFSQLKRLSTFELERMNVVGFPKLLMLSRDMLSGELSDEYGERLARLIQEGLLEETSSGYNLTSKGKCFIDDIYYCMLDEQEKSIVDKQIKVLKLC